MIVISTISCKKLEDINPKVDAKWEITYFDGNTETYEKKIDPSDDLIMDVNNCIYFKYDSYHSVRCHVKNYQRIK